VLLCLEGSNFIHHHIFGHVQKDDEVDGFDSPT